MNALGVDAPDGGKWNEWTGVDELRRICGYSAVSPDYGLAYGNGQDLETVYNTYGFPRAATGRGWPDLAYLCELGVGQVGGARLYHWMGVRGYDGAVFHSRTRRTRTRASRTTWTRTSGTPGAAGHA